MFVSQARIEANRRNARLSTGPKTPEGKAKSRANALKHGLCSSVVVAEDLTLVQQRSTEFFDTFKPQNEVHVYMVEQAALASIRIERCQRMERRVRDKISLRAELTWDSDKRLEVEMTARSLANEPGPTVEALRRTMHGCEWLITRWAMLAYSADTQPEGWSEAQNRLAFDLLGTPALFREGRKPGVSIDDEGRVVDPSGDLASFARSQIASLKAHRDDLADLDESERVLTANDLTNDGDLELRRLRRYESSLFGKLRWHIRQIDVQSPYRCPDPSLRPKWVVDLEEKKEPEPKPAPKTPEEIAIETWKPTDLHPPFDLTPDEIPPIGVDPDIPAIIQARKEKKIRKAEARRESKRRKLERLRA